MHVDHGQTIPHLAEEQGNVSQHALGAAGSREDVARHFFWPVLAIYLIHESPQDVSSRRQGVRRRVKKKEEWQVSPNGSYAGDMATLFRSLASLCFHQRR